jgi:DNA-binding transcriptional LysR family regulator
MALDANRLRVFVEVAHSGSISGAARRMSFTAPAVSQQVTKLEQEAGCVLVERGHAGLRLTEAGRVLLQHAERVLGELHDAEAAVRAAAGRRPRRLALGAFASAAKALVPPALVAFGSAHPHISLALQDIEPPGGYDLVTAAEIDLLITHRYPGTELPSAAGLHREPLHDDPLLLVVPEGHPAAGAARADLAELAAEDWICGAPGVFNRVTLDLVAAQADVELHVAYETRDYEVTLALVRAGLGVSLIPETCLRTAPHQGWRAVAVRGSQPAREIYAVHRRRPQQPVSEMVATLRRAAAE